MHLGEANDDIPEMEIETRKRLWIYTVVYDWYALDNSGQISAKVFQVNG